MLLQTQPGLPNIDILKEGRNFTKYGAGGAWQAGTVNADSGDAIDWRATYKSNGEFPALNSVIQETLPVDVSMVAGSFSTSNCGTCAEADYFSAKGCNIGTMTGTQTQQVYSNPVGQILGGILSGASALGGLGWKPFG